MGTNQQGTTGIEPAPPVDPMPSILSPHAWVNWLILGLLALIIWAALIVYRPLTPCRHCDNGKDWDDGREHYGLRCNGWPWLPILRWGSCYGAGRKLRWELRVLRLVGVGGSIPDPVAAARGS